MGTVDIVSYMTQALYLTLWLSLPGRIITWF